MYLLPSSVAKDGSKSCPIRPSNKDIVPRVAQPPTAILKRVTRPRRNAQMFRKQGGERPEMLSEEMADTSLEFLGARESVAVCQGMAFNWRLTLQVLCQPSWVKVCLTVIGI